ncbi:hypothetical protein ACP8Y2_17745 [Herpetosiphon llansteffanensis]
MLEKIARKLASLGLPGVVFVVVLSTQGLLGLSGAAAITSTLSFLGGPVGMIGGISLLVLLVPVGEILGKYGLEKVLLAIYQERMKQGTSLTKITNEIKKIGVSESLQAKIIAQLQ